MEGEQKKRQVNRRNVSVWSGNNAVEAVRSAIKRKLQAMPEAMVVRRCTVERVFDTIKGWMGATPPPNARLNNIVTEPGLVILA